MIIYNLYLTTNIYNYYFLMPKRKKTKINKKSKSKSIAKENNNSKDKLQKKNMEY